MLELLAKSFLLAVGLGLAPVIDIVTAALDIVVLDAVALGTDFVVAWVH